jgi:hypothetical protein
MEVKFFNTLETRLGILLDAKVIAFLTRLSAY